MAFTVKSKKSGTDYFLHGKPAQNGKSTLYFFKKVVDPEFAIDELPDGKVVSENTHTGLPILSNKKAE